jgi:hypothetical protein
MYFQSVPTPKTTTASPYGIFLGILTRDWKSLWCKMVEPSDDHVLLDMNINNSGAIVDLFQYQVITYFWMCFRHISTSGTGMIYANPVRSPRYKEIYFGGPCGLQESY